MFPSKSIHTDGVRAGIMVMLSVDTRFFVVANQLLSRRSGLVKWVELLLFCTLDISWERWNQPTTSNTGSVTGFGLFNRTRQ